MASKLDELLGEIRRCRICRDAPKYGKTLPHEPRPVIAATRSAGILIAGQAPGTRVHASGVPFTDPSGDRLRDWMGIDHETFYDSRRVAIVPMGFCFPGLDEKGGDLPPRRECREIWHDRVVETLKEIRLALVIGQYAHAYHLGNFREKSLTLTVANWQQIRDRARPYRVYALPHPSWRNNAWLKKNPWFERDLLPELRSDIAAILKN